MVDAVAPVSFPIVAGTHVKLEFTVQDDDGNVVSLIGGNGRFAMARTPHDTTLVVDSNASPAEATLTIVDAANGRLDVDITDEITDALLGDYYYELVWQDSLTRMMPTARGYITVEPNLLSSV